MSILVTELRMIAADGVTARQAAVRLDCSTGTIYRLAGAHGIPLAKAGPVKVRKNALRKLIDEGLTQTEIAARMGVSATTVSTARKRWGFALKTQPGRLTKVTKCKLVNFDLRGMTLSEIAAELGVTVSAVTKARAKFGLSRRVSEGKIKKNALRQAIDDGLTRKQIAARLGVRLESVVRAAARFDIALPGSPYAKAQTKPEPPETDPVVDVPAPKLPAVPNEPDKVKVRVDVPPATEFWTPARDAKVIETQGRYAALNALADRWRVPVRKVQARAHRLRLRPVTRAAVAAE